MLEIDQFRVQPGSRVSLRGIDPAETGGITRPMAAKLLKESIRELAAQQDVLYAQDRYALLVVLQAMDAAGKDGTIKHVMTGVNLQGCQVFTFTAPSAEELDHDFLWRTAKALPERGRIGIHNGSYYEEVLVTRVHPELAVGTLIADALRGLDLHYPTLGPERRQELLEARRLLMAEGRRR